MKLKSMTDSTSPIPLSVTASIDSWEILPLLYQIKSFLDKRHVFKAKEIMFFINTEYASALCVLLQTSILLEQNWQFYNVRISLSQNKPAARKIRNRSFHAF